MGGCYDRRTVLRNQLPQRFLYFLPLPHRQRSIVTGLRAPRFCDYRPRMR
jgi:hypothetical protein